MPHRKGQHAYVLAQTKISRVYVSKTKERFLQPRGASHLCSEAKETEHCLGLRPSCRGVSLPRGEKKPMFQTTVLGKEPQYTQISIFHLNLFPFQFSGRFPYSFLKPAKNGRGRRQRAFPVHLGSSLYADFSSTHQHAEM